MHSPLHTRTEASVSIVPITSTAPACYGIACRQHGQCARYHAVEATSPDHTIPLCDDGKGGRPMFVELRREEA